MSRFVNWSDNMHCRFIETRIFPVSMYPMHYLLLQLSACEFQMASGGNDFTFQKGLTGFSSEKKILNNTDHCYHRLIFP